MTAPNEGTGTDSPESVSAPEFLYNCNGYGSTYHVAQENINIRATPGGSIKSPISKGAVFVSRGYPGGDRDRTCFAQVGERTWVYGIGESNLVLGWVGLDWLVLVS